MAPLNRLCHFLSAAFPKHMSLPVSPERRATWHSDTQRHTHALTHMHTQTHMCRDVHRQRTHPFRHTIAVPLVSPRLPPHPTSSHCDIDRRFPRFRHHRAWMSLSTVIHSLCLHRCLNKCSMLWHSLSLKPLTRGSHVIPFWGIEYSGDITKIYFPY